jgi:hypothetical protein
MKKKYYVAFVCIIIAVALFESFNPFRIRGLRALESEVEKFEYFPTSVLENRYVSSKNRAFVDLQFTDDLEIEPVEVVAFYEGEFEKMDGQEL